MGAPGPVVALAYVDRPLAAWRMWEGQGSTDVPMMLGAARIRAKTFLNSAGRTRRKIWWASAARRLWLGRTGCKHPHFLHLARMGGRPDSWHTQSPPWLHRQWPSVAYGESNL